MKTHHIEITTHGICGDIKIDGISLSEMVKRYTVVHEAGQKPIVQVELIGEVTIDGDFIAPLPEPWRSIYHNPLQEQI